MRYTQKARIKRRRVVVRQLRFLHAYSHGIALRTCNKKQAPTQWLRDVVAMESFAGIRDLKVMPASFAVNYYSSLWTSWISCRPMCCGFRCLGMWISYMPKCCGPQHLGTQACTKSTCLNIEIVDFDLQTGGFRTVSGFRGFQFLGIGFRTFCGFRFLGRPTRGSRILEIIQLINDD